MAGNIEWIDLTVDDAESVRDFYAAVAGWRPEPVAMGEYSDYSMCGPDGTPLAGVCHARGDNKGIPPQWLIYIPVADLDASMATCVDHGGRIVREPTPLMGGRMCVMADPAGAVAAYYQKAPE